MEEGREEGEGFGRRETKRTLAETLHDSLGSKSLRLEREEPEGLNQERNARTTDVSLR